MIKFLPLDFLSVSRRVLWKNENAVYGLQISALVPVIFKFEKRVKYANDMTDWEADSSTGNTPMALKKFCSHRSSLFPSPYPLDFNMLVIFSLKMLNKATNSS